MRKKAADSDKIRVKKWLSTETDFQKNTNDLNPAGSRPYFQHSASEGGSRRYLVWRAGEPGHPPLPFLSTTSTSIWLGILERMSRTVSFSIWFWLVYCCVLIENACLYRILWQQMLVCDPKCQILMGKKG